MNAIYYNGIFLSFVLQFHQSEQYFPYWNNNFVNLNAKCYIQKFMYLNWKNLYREIKLWKDTKAVSQVQLTAERTCFVKQIVNVSHWNYPLTTSTRPYCSSAVAFKWLFCIQNETREWTLRCSVATKNMGRETDQSFLYTSSSPCK